MMKKKRHMLRRELLPILVLVCMAAWVAFGASVYGQAAEGMVLSQFRMRETDDQGRPTWELEGKEAKVGEVTVVMQDVRLTVFRPGKDDLVVTSPACKYNRATGVIEGEGPVHAETKGFCIDGRGYRILTGQQRLYIEKDVNMVIAGNAEPFKTDEKIGDGEDKSTKAQAGGDKAGQIE